MKGSATDALSLPSRESGIRFCNCPVPTEPPTAGLTSGHAKGFVGSYQQPTVSQRPVALAGSLVFAFAAPDMLILNGETGPMIALGPSARSG